VPSLCTQDRILSQCDKQENSSRITLLSVYISTTVTVYW